MVLGVVFCGGNGNAGCIFILLLRRLPAIKTIRLQIYIPSIYLYFLMLTPIAKNEFTFPKFLFTQVFLSLTDQILVNSS